MRKREIERAKDFLSILEKTILWKPVGNLTALKN